MADEKRWIQQAEADLSAAQDSLKTGHCEWACFQSQQAAETGLKAFLFSRGRTTIVSHSLADLVRAAETLEAVFAALKPEAKSLDGFYISTRYPNGLASVDPPARYFDPSDATQCIRFAQSILNACLNFVTP
ncbi:MAG: HEPN domain-containing protein [Planctomycetes bacterium]|nr:HEPN domain-containing protein [Planctomycetota bacterium]